MKTCLRRPTAALAGVLAVVLTGWAAVEAAGGPLTPGERRGRQIYLRGSGAEGREIAAVLGDGAAQVSAGILPCVQCHGWEGRGRAEAGIPPTDITWAALTAPDGRGHPHYTEGTLAR